VISATLATLKLRNRLLSLTSPTTGSTTLSVTTTGYARAAGSFITDGFAVGMEITASGFSTSANNGQGIITALAATAMTVGDAYTVSTHATDGYTAVARTLATEGSASARTISVTVPAMRAFDNATLRPIGGKPYLEEELVPATTRVLTLPISQGYAEDTGVYVLRWFGLSGKGVTAIRKGADAVLALFTPGTTFTMSDNNTLRIPSDFGPRAGQITRVEGGWSYVLIEVPYIGTSINAVAA
jgi:hypothetical protein